MAPAPDDEIMPYTECYVGTTMAVVRMDSLCTGMDGVISLTDAIRHAKEQPEQVRVQRISEGCEVANGTIVQTYGTFQTQLKFKSEDPGTQCVVPVTLTIMKGAGDMIIGWRTWKKHGISLETMDGTVKFGHHGFTKPLLTKLALRKQDRGARETLEIRAMEAAQQATFGDEENSKDYFLGCSPSTLLK
jgi:hypothetical protein